MKRAAVVVLAWLLAGSIAITTTAGSNEDDLREVELRLGALVAGSSGGQNWSDASASVAGSLISIRTDMLWLNNTNASGPWYAKLILVGSSGVDDIVTMTLGIDNGTTSTGQVLGLTGSITQAEGSYVRMDAGAAGKIYLTHAVAIGATTTTLAVQVRAADSSAEEAYVTTYANFTLT